MTDAPHTPWSPDAPDGHPRDYPETYEYVAPATPVWPLWGTLLILVALSGGAWALAVWLVPGVLG